MMCVCVYIYWPSVWEYILVLNLFCWLFLVILASMVIIIPRHMKQNLQYTHIYIYTYINILNKMHLMQQLIISNIQQLELFINQISQILTNFWINILLLLSDAFFYIIGKYISFILYFFFFDYKYNFIVLSLSHCSIYMFEVWTLNYIKNRKYSIYFFKTFFCCWHEYMLRIYDYRELPKLREQKLFIPL